MNSNILIVDTTPSRAVKFAESLASYNLEARVISDASSLRIAYSQRKPLAIFAWDDALDATISQTLSRCRQGFLSNLIPLVLVADPERRDADAFGDLSPLSVEDEDVNLDLIIPRVRALNKGYSILKLLEMQTRSTPLQHLNEESNAFEQVLQTSCAVFDSENTHLKDHPLNGVSDPKKAKISLLFYDEKNDLGAALAKLPKGTGRIVLTRSKNTETYQKALRFGAMDILDQDAPIQNIMLGILNVARFLDRRSVLFSRLKHLSKDPFHEPVTGVFSEFYSERMLRRLRFGDDVRNFGLIYLSIKVSNDLQSETLDPVGSLREVVVSTQLSRHLPTGGFVFRDGETGFILGAPKIKTTELTELKAQIVHAAELALSYAGMEPFEVHAASGVWQTNSQSPKEIITALKEYLHSDTSQEAPKEHVEKYA